MRSGRRFGMGDKVMIRVISANLDKRQLDYEWVLKPDEEIAMPKKKERRKKKKE